MKNSIFSRICFIVAATAAAGLPAVAFAQERSGRTPTSFDLDEEQLTIEADIPSVDLILSFREIQERNQGMKESFVDEIVESAKNDPF